MGADWHFDERFEDGLFAALAGGDPTGVLSGFAPGQVLGGLAEALLEAVCHAAQQLWARQLQDRVCALRVAEVVARLGFSDPNSPFVRKLQELLEQHRDAVVKTDLEIVAAIVAKAKIRRAHDSLPTTRFAFCRAGAFWHLTYEGQTTHVEDSVGARYIAIVLDAPDRHFLASELTRIAGGGPAMELGPETAHDQIDGRTFAEIRKRLTELEAELAEARESGNEGRQEELQSEKEKIVSYVTKANGVLGAGRRFQTRNDRARTAVTTAIDRTLKRDSVRRALPAAWRHLKSCIQTGACIQYCPDRTITWEVSMDA